MKALRRQLFVLAFFDEFVPLYALFAIWFLNNGISTARISLVLAVWSVVALLLEIPSGALADRVDRRRVIALAYLLRMAGIALWLVWPSLTGILLGTVLWATHDALASGAWEAMIYDELQRLGQSDSYAQIMARMTQAAWLAVAASAVAAWALVDPIGIAGVGWTSVAVLLVAFVLVLRLPGAPKIEDHDEPTTYAAWLTTLKDGVNAARTVPVLGRLVVLGALVETMEIFEEYIPFLAEDRGANTREIPVILGLAWLGFVLGAEVAARRPELAASSQAVMLALGAVAGVVAINGAGGPWLIVAFAFLHTGVQTTMTLADARLQERAEAAARATVSSVRGFLSGALALVTFAMIGLMGNEGDVRPGLYVLLVPLTIAAFLTWRWLPPPLRPDADKRS